MRRLDTIIFDVSGVLLNDLYAVWKADSDALDACGFKTIENIERFKELFKFPISKFYRTMGIPNKSIPALENKFRHFYPKYVNYIKIFPEVKPLLKTVKQMKKRLAIVSNIPSQFLLEHLQKFQINKYFEVVTGQDDCEEQKPSPKPILITLQKLRSNPKESVYIGDMEEDIISGRRADVYTCAISRDESYHPLWKLKRQKPDFIIKTLFELCTIL